MSLAYPFLAIAQQGVLNDENARLPRGSRRQLFLILSRCSPGSHWGTRFTQRHVDDRRPVAAGCAAGVRRDHQPGRQGLDPLVAAHRGAAEGRAERAADHNRRRGLRRLGHLRRRHPDTDTRSGRGGRAALHAVPLHRALLAHPRGADHRAQPPFVGLRRDRRASHRLSGLRFDHRSGQRHDREHPQGPRLRHLVVRQEPQHPHLRLFDLGPVRSVALGHGLRLFLRLHGRRIQPVGALAVPRPHPDLPVGETSPAST